MSLYPFKMVSREEWGALPPKGEPIPDFEYPALHVILTLKTDFGECNTKEECIKKVQQIQKLHMEEWGLPDIAYNFLLGDDGNIFVGRGWDKRPAKTIGRNVTFDSRTYDFALIGDYCADVPDSIYQKFNFLREYGSQFNYINVEYLTMPFVDKKETYLR